MKAKKILATILVITTILCIFSNDVYAYSESKNGASCSFTSSCSGATDIIVKCAENVEVKIYDKNVLSKKLLKSSTSTKKIKYTSKLSSKNTYYITVKTKSGKSAKITCKIKQHLDKKKSSKGGIWKCNDDSPVPNPTIIHLKKTYFTAAQCSEAVTYVSSSKYLDTQTALVNGTLSVSGIILGGCGIKSLTVASTFLAIGQLGYSANFKNDTMNDIKSKGNYNKNTNKFENGVVLTEYVYNGMTFITVDKWNGKKMKGKKGYIGTWQW